MFDPMKSMINYSKLSGCRLNHAPRNCRYCLDRYNKIRERFFDKESDYAKCVDPDDMTMQDFVKLVDELVDIRKRNCNC
jgi:hypothetical protein